VTNQILRAGRRRAGGFTLIEVLVAVVVMSLGLLGVAALQAAALKSSRSALYRSYATFHAYDVADCMRVNRNAAVNAAYNLNFNTAATGGTVAGNDMVAWKAALARDMPGGQGSITVDGNGRALIQVRWNEGVESDRSVLFTTQTTL
jgi:type IV pilus assembly protein PilV